MNALFICLSLVTLIYRLEYFSSLIYIGAYIMPIVFIVKTSIKKNIKIRLLSFMAIIFFVIYGFFSFLISDKNDGARIHVKNFYFYLYFYYCLVFLISNFDRNKIIKYLKIIVVFFLFFIVAECSLRYYIVLISGNLIRSHYAFKEGTILFHSDTNILGLLISNIICLAIFLYSYTKDKFWNCIAFVFLFFLLLTFSLACIITVFMIFVIRHFITNIKKTYYVRMFFETIVLITVLFVLFLLVKDIGSFSTKIDVMKSFKLFFNIPLSNQLFGFGFINGATVYSYKPGEPAHLHVAFFLGQVGIIGLLLFIGMYYLIYIDSKRQSFFLMLNFLITGFSVINNDPSFFYSCAVITVLSRKKYLSRRN